MLSPCASPVDFTTAPASETHDVGIVHNVHNHPNDGEIDAILSQHVPQYVLSFLSDEAVKIVPLPEDVTYARASTVIRRLIVGGNEFCYRDDPSAGTRSMTAPRRRVTASRAWTASRSLAALTSD